jgi:hypothetical protein
MNIKLGLYETIDNHFNEWLSYPIALKLDFIISDVEVYGRFKFNKRIDRAEHFSLKKINILVDSFNRVKLEDKQKLKNIYLEFIDEICKPDKIYMHTDEENYTIKDEYNVVKNKKLTDEDEEELERIFSDNIEQLNILTKETRLSHIENNALKYLRSQRKEKDKSLNIFTLEGIIQIANRGAYKLHWKRSSSQYK